MLIQEVTNAQDQLSLLKRIFDNTWSAVAAEAQAEKAAQQQRAAAAASKPRARRAAPPAPKRAADTSTAPTAQKNVPQQPKATAAERTAAQLVLRSQNDAQAQQSQQPQQPTQTQQRRSYPARQQAKPKLYAPPKPVARLGKVVAQRIK